MCTRGSLTSAAPTSPSPGSSETASAGTPPSRSARKIISAQPGDCSAGLSTTALPVARPARDHPERDREREVPRRDDGDDPARAVAHRVALARHLQQRGALRDVERAAGVVLEEVDRLADVRVGLGPRLRALAHGQRGRLQAPLAQPLRGPQQRVRALLGRRRGPALGAALRGLQRRVDVLRRRLGRRGHDPLGLAGVRRDELLAVALVVADPHRHLQRRPRIVRADRLVERRAHGRPAQLEDRLVGELLHAVTVPGGASSASIEAPRAWSARKESLEVFSSRRRTR